MPAPVVLLTALLTGTAALVLTGWTRRLAHDDATWPSSGLHAVLASLGGAGAASLASGWAELVAFAALGLACALLVVVDLAAHRLPDVLVGPAYPVLFAGLTASAALDGDWSRLGRAALAAVVLALAHLLLALVSPSGLGLGDVKLAGLLGGFLGWLGWPQVLVGTLATFVLGGLVALVLVLTTRATRRTHLAFGPWLVAGAAVGAAWGPSLVSAAT